MPTFRTPRPKQVALPPDYLLDSVYQNTQVAFLPVQFLSQIGVYNSSAPGRVLIVYNFSFFTGAAARVTAALLTGPLNNYGVSGQPLYPLGAAGAGIFVHQDTSSVAASSQIAQWTVAANVMFVWPYPYPFFVVPAGYTLFFYPSQDGVELTLNLYWLETPFI